MQALLLLIDPMAVLDEDLVDFQLDCLTLHNLLLQSSLRYKAVNENLLLLANSVCPVHRLQVDLRVKV